MIYHKKVVVAGNHEQFLRWCTENKLHPREALEVTQSDHVKGLSLTREQVVWIGTYYDREDIHEIRQEIDARIFFP